MVLQSIFHTWIPFIYLYVVGGVFFFSGIYIIIKSGSLNLTRRHHRNWIKVLVGGFIFFMCLHAFLIIAALYF